MTNQDCQDFAFELECDAFKWRWETCLLSSRMSAEVLSKHLIMPLISITHFAFASADPVSELSESDLEQVRLANSFRYVSLN
jgi:hypothetical protein